MATKKDAKKKSRTKVKGIRKAERDYIRDMQLRETIAALIVIVAGLLVVAWMVAQTREALQL